MLFFFIKFPLAIFLLTVNLILKHHKNIFRRLLYCFLMISKYCGFLFANNGLLLNGNSQ